MRREKVKRTVGFSYNEFVLTRGLKNVFELSKICSKLHPLCKFDTPVDRFRDRIVRVSVCTCPRILWYTLSSNSKASSLERCFPVLCSFFWKFKNEWKWQYADRACACSSKRGKAELSTSDNIRMCGCCFKTLFGNFKSGWRDSANMFVAPARKDERYQSWPTF